MFDDEVQERMVMLVQDFQDNLCCFWILWYDFLNHSWLDMLDLAPTEFLNSWWIVRFKHSQLFNQKFRVLKHLLKSRERLVVLEVLVS